MNWEEYINGFVDMCPTTEDNRFFLLSESTYSRGLAKLTEAINQGNLEWIRDNKNLIHDQFMWYKEMVRRIKKYKARGGEIRQYVCRDSMSRDSLMRVKIPADGIILFPIPSHFDLETINRWFLSTDRLIKHAEIRAAKHIRYKSV